MTKTQSRPSSVDGARAQRLWTVPVHVFDQRVDTPKKSIDSLVEPLRNTLRIRFHHSAPHHGGLFPRRERLPDGPAPEPRDALVVGDALRVARAERLVEALPEIRQSHPSSVPSSPPATLERRAHGPDRGSGRRHSRRPGKTGHRKNCHATILIRRPTAGTDDF